MNVQEKTFEKYKTRGSDYHWKEMNRLNPLAFNAYLHARYEIITKILSEAITEKKYDRKNEISVIDFGCGDGVQLNSVKKLNDKRIALKLYGIDLSEEALKTAKKRIPDTSFKIASTYETGFTENYFDISLSSDVIEHVLDPSRMIDEMIRVTKPGGHIIIATPVKYTEVPLDTMHVQEFFPNEFSELFAKRSDVKIIMHKLSHPLKDTLSYNHPVTIFGKRIPIFKYVMNTIFLLTNFNPLRKTITARANDHVLMTYQFILIKKATD